MADIAKMREEFEISFVAQTACMLPEGEDVSRKDFATILLGAMVDDRKGNSYGTDLYKVGWWAWQASRQAVVVELPPIPPIPEDPEEAIDDSHMDAYHTAVRMRSACAESVEAQGLAVKS